MKDYRALTSHKPDLKEYCWRPEGENFEIEYDGDTGGRFEL